MKILELVLDAFGPFTDVALDLSAGQEGLHLIYGANEAGKSSALRALRQALFGIPAQSPDNFVHPYSKMRVGLSVRGGDGGILQFIRRKGNRGTLLTADGVTPLADEILGRFLNGLSETEFKSRFALDHDELVEGGKVILQGGGELGAVLFQAGGGLKNLLDVQRELDRELENLFKPGGSKPRINARLAELRAKKETLRNTSLRSAEWLEHDTASRRARERLDEVEVELAAKQAARRRLERLKEALPLLIRQQRSEQELSRLGEVPLLSDAFPKTRIEALGLREATLAARERTLGTMIRLDCEIAELAVPEELLAESGAIENLRDRLGTDRKVRKALPAEEANLVQILASAQDLLAELQPNLRQQQRVVRPEEARGSPPQESVLSLEELIATAEPLKLTRMQKSAIQKLASEWTRLKAEQEQIQKQLAELSTQLSADQTERKGLLTPGQTSPLERALKQSQDQGDLDRTLETARTRLALAEQEAACALAQLPLWTGTLEELETASLPTSETIDRFEAVFAELEAQRDHHRAVRNQVVLEYTEAEAALEQLRQAAGTVPSEDDLARTRADRDRLWQLIRGAWEGNRLPAAEAVQKILGSGCPPIITPETVAGCFEHLRDKADLQADRLRREIERVTKQATAQAILYKTRQRLEFLATEEEQIAHRDAEVQRQWSTTWASLAISPLSPREMRRWLQLRGDLLKQATEIRSGRSEVETIERRLITHRRQLVQQLQVLGEPTCSCDEPLAALRDRADARLKQLAAIESRRSKLIEAETKLQRQMDGAQRQGRAVEERLNSWRSEWATLIVPLGFDMEAPAEQVLELVNQASDLQTKLKEARDTQTRMSGLQREAAQFAHDLEEVCRRVAPDLIVDARPGSPSVDMAAAELFRRFRAAEETRARRQSLIQQRDTERANLERLEVLLEESDRQLAALCREANCSEIDELPGVEERSRVARELRDRLKALEEQIQELCGNEEHEAFRQAALTLDPDRLPDQLQALIDEITRLDSHRGELNRLLGREQQILEQMDGSSQAAEAAEMAEELKARLGLEVEEYARLRLAAIVLREAIERYRQRSQGPILDRAAVLFRQLTLGSFESLKVGYDDQDQAMLQAIRPGGTAMVGIEGLSEGTADQLYLALRLASLEVYLESHEPIPLVVDDILIQFDDRRATAALEVLADLSRRTQVVLFTHHEHLCRLAQACVDSERLIIHQLPGRQQAARKDLHGLADPSR